MAIYVIADLHLSLGCDKPMDVFAGWQNYMQRIEQNWCKTIRDDDTIVIPGDVSWAMQLEHCTEDFAFLNALPGTKLIGKGNHDYWWTTMHKMETYLSEHGFNSLHFLFNNSYDVEGVSLCGTRGWSFDLAQEHDAKMMNREVSRLLLSLSMATQNEKIVFLHYPPLYADLKAEEIITVMRESGVRECYYGHLHGAAVQAFQGEENGIRYRLVAADALNFCPLRIR